MILKEWIPKEKLKKMILLYKKSVYAMMSILNLIRDFHLRPTTLYISYPIVIRKNFPQESFFMGIFLVMGVVNKLET